MFPLRQTRPCLALPPGSAHPSSSCSGNFQTFQHSNLSTFRQRIHSSPATAPLTPFPATLSGKSQLIENPAALSPVVATLTRHLHLNPFVCHSYKKHPGARIPSECHPERGEGSSFSRSFSPLPRQSHPSKGNPAIVAALSLPLVTSHQSLVTASVLSLPPVTSHQSRITNSFRIRTSIKSASKLFRMNTSKTQDLKPFRMNTYKKTGRGDPPPTLLPHNSLFTTHYPLPFMESAGFCALSASCFRTTSAALSSRPCPSLPGRAESTARAIAAFCVDTKAIRDTPDARPSIPLSVLVPCQSCASISPVGRPSFSAPSRPPRPMSGPAAQSASSVAPACAGFLSPSCRNSSPARAARWPSPSCAEPPANRATRLRPSTHTAATASPLLRPESCTPRAAKSPACGPAIFCKSLPPAHSRQSPPAPRCTPPSATENPAPRDGAARWD